MKDVFICLLMNLKNHGKITSASMYNDGFSKIKLDDGDSEYEVSVMRKEKFGEVNIDV